MEESARSSLINEDSGKKPKNFNPQVPSKAYLTFAPEVKEVSSQAWKVNIQIDNIALKKFEFERKHLDEHREELSKRQ